MRRMARNIEPAKRNTGGEDLDLKSAPQVRISTHIINPCRLSKRYKHTAPLISPVLKLEEHGGFRLSTCLGTGHLLRRRRRRRRKRRWWYREKVAGEEDVLSLVAQDSSLNWSSRFRGIRRVFPFVFRVIVNMGAMAIMRHRQVLNHASHSRHTRGK
jgi:hypothetical protein